MSLEGGLHTARSRVGLLTSGARQQRERKVSGDRGHRGDSLGPHDRASDHGGNGRGWGTSRAADGVARCIDRAMTVVVAEARGFAVACCSVAVRRADISNMPQRTRRLCGRDHAIGTVLSTTVEARRRVVDSAAGAGAGEWRGS